MPLVGRARTFVALAGAAGAAALALTLFVTVASPASAAASSSGGETINCEPGQTANSDLGACVDPVCGAGTQRDPTGRTRSCVAISCPPEEHLQGQTCVPNFVPPNNKCPDGSVGSLHHLSTGVTVLDCPKQLPPGHTRPRPVSTPPSAGIRGN
jgi:hypothetical protein